MPVYTCRERPPVAALFRSGRPMREWGLAEACASNGAVFASTVFADEETQEALRMLAAELFKPGAAVREVASCVGKQDATRASLLGDESSPAGKRSHDHLISEGATGDLRGPSRKVAARTEHCAGRGPAFCDRGNDSMDLSDDDFDLLVTKRPASTHALPSGIRRKGNAVVASGRDGHLIPGDSQNLQELPINHYEKMVQSRHDADAEEPSPWDRALLPAGRGPGRLVEAENVADKASSRKHGSGGAMREGGGKKKDSGIAPFFGGVAQGKMDKARKEVQCSNCHQVGHTKRTCPSADSAREKDGAGNEKKGQKKSKLDACENDPQQSVNEKLSALSRVATNAGTLDGSQGLQDLLQRVTACSCVVFGVLYTNNDSNLREKVRKGGVEREALGCCLLLTDHISADDERSANIFVPFMQNSLIFNGPKQAPGFNTTLEQRRDFLQRVFSPAVPCPLVCFHARPCLLALSPFCQFQPEAFSEAAVCCLSVGQWLLDPEVDPTAISFDKFAHTTLGISPFSADNTQRTSSTIAKAAGGTMEAVASVQESLVCNVVDLDFCRLLFQDLTLCGQIWDSMANDLRERDMEGAATLEMCLIPIICMMEEEGVGFSPTQLIKERRAMERKLIELEEEATKVVGHPVLLTSPQQLCSVLFEELQLPPPKNGLSASTAGNSTSKFKGSNQQYSTNEEVLSALVDLHPLPAIVLEHRHISKMLGGFVVPLCERAIRAAERDGISSIHTRWSQTSTATGRLSSSEPNLQNVPKQESVRFGNRNDMTKEINVRNAFVPRQDKLLLSIDYVQCELRIMAHFCEDSALISLLHGDQCPYSGIAARIQRKDVSAVTSRERQIYKTVVLGLLYGQGQKSLAAKLNMTESQSAKTISTFFNTFPKVREFKSRTLRSAKEQGFVTTLSGRRRCFPDLHLQGDGTGFKRAYAERQSVNFVIQGSASDFIKTAMKDITTRLCVEKLFDRCCCCLQIHDELVFEVDPSVLAQCAALISKCMTECAQLRVPMRVKAQVGKTWGEMVPLEDAHVLLRDVSDVHQSVPQRAVSHAASGEPEVGLTAGASSAPAHNAAPFLEEADGIVSLGSAPDSAAATNQVVSASENGSVAAGLSSTSSESNNGDGKVNAKPSEAQPIADGTFGIGRAAGGQTTWRGSWDSEGAHGGTSPKAGAGDSMSSRQAAHGEGTRPDDEAERAGELATNQLLRHNPIEAMFDFEFLKPSCAPLPSQPSQRSATPLDRKPQEGGGFNGGHEHEPKTEHAAASGGEAHALRTELANADGLPSKGQNSQGCSQAASRQDSTCPSGVPLREIALSGLNLNPLRANRLVGGPVKSKFTQYSSLSSALFDDDTDLLDLDD